MSASQSLDAKGAHALLKALGDRVAGGSTLEPDARASAARQLLEQLRPGLAFAGVKTDLGATAAQAPASLEQVVQDILTDIHTTPTLATH